MSVAKQIQHCSFIVCSTVTLSALTAKRRIFSNDHFSSKKLGPLSVPLFTRPTSAKETTTISIRPFFSWVGAERCWKWCVFICSFSAIDSRRLSSYFQQLFKTSDVSDHLQIWRFRFRDVRILVRPTTVDGPIFTTRVSLALHQPMIFNSRFWKHWSTLSSSSMNVSSLLLIAPTIVFCLKIQYDTTANTRWLPTGGLCRFTRSYVADQLEEDSDDEKCPAPERSSLKSRQLITRCCWSFEHRTSISSIRQ